MTYFNSSLFRFKIFFLAAIWLMMAQGASAQSRYRNNFRTGIGFAFIVDDDNSGALFSNQYTHEFTDRLNGSLSLEYLSSSRYEKGRNLFTSRKAFIMVDASVLFDLVENEKTTIKIGVGPAMRRRSELDLAVLSASGTGQVDADAYVSNRTVDYGGKIVLANDFYNDNRLFFGWRAAGYIYDEGSSIFTVGLNMGFSF